MADRKYYVRCQNGCLYESMTKEQILAAITQAAETGTVGDVDTGFVTTLKTVNGKGLKFFFGTQAEYETLTAEERSNLFALITNDTSRESFIAAIEELRSRTDGIEIRTGNVESIAADLTERTANLEATAAILESRTEEILPYKEVQDAVIRSAGWYFGHIYLEDSDSFAEIPLFNLLRVKESVYPASFPYSLKIERDGTCKCVEAKVNVDFGTIYFQEKSNVQIAIRKLEY